MKTCNVFYLNMCLFTIGVWDLFFTRGVCVMHVGTQILQLEGKLLETRMTSALYISVFPLYSQCLSHT